MRKKSRGQKRFFVEKSRLKVKYEKESAMKRILRPRKAKTNLRGRIRKPSSKKNRYRVRNWSEYNKALKERGSLKIWFSEEAIQAPLPCSPIRGRGALIKEGHRSFTLIWL
ncbi:MAG: hypothetical protein ACUVUQ_11710, partial [Thermodesulfovibrionales bacterium]